MKWLSYAIVCLLNLNVMMSSFGKKHTDRGYKSVYHGLYDLYYNGNPNADYNVSLFITLAMGFVNVCGYITIAAFLATTEVPLVVNLTDKLIKDAEYASPVSLVGEDFGLKVTHLCVELHACYFRILLRFLCFGSVAPVRCACSVHVLHVRFLPSPSWPLFLPMFLPYMCTPPPCTPTTAPEALPVSPRVSLVALGHCCGDALHRHARRQLPRQD